MLYIQDARGAWCDVDSLCKLPILMSPTAPTEFAAWVYQISYAFAKYGLILDPINLQMIYISIPSSGTSEDKCKKLNSIVMNYMSIIRKIVDIRKNYAQLYPKRKYLVPLLFYPIPNVIPMVVSFNDFHTEEAKTTFINRYKEYMNGELYKGIHNIERLFRAIFTNFAKIAGLQKRITKRSAFNT
jgi:hypothetical protein